MKSILFSILGCRPNINTRFEWMKKYSLKYLDDSYKVLYFVGNSNIDNNFSEKDDVVYLSCGDKWRHLIEKYIKMFSYLVDYTDFEYYWISDDDVFICFDIFNNIHNIIDPNIDMYIHSGINCVEPMKFPLVFGLTRVKEVVDSDLSRVSLNPQTIIVNNISSYERFWQSGGGFFTNKRFLKFCRDAFDDNQDRFDYQSINPLNDGNGFADVYFSNCINRYIHKRKEDYRIQGQSDFLLGHAHIEDYNSSIWSYHSPYLNNEQNFKYVYDKYFSFLNDGGFFVNEENFD